MEKMTPTQQYALAVMHDALIVADDYINGNESDYTILEVTAKIREAIDLGSIHLPMTNPPF